MWTVSKEFTFDAAHSLPHLPETHKCHRMHGHTYTVRIHCSGDLDPAMGWVVDYAQIKAVMQPLINQIDHQNLNEVIGVQTTAENIAFWFYIRTRASLPVSRVDVHETTGTCCSYTPRA